MADRTRGGGAAGVTRSAVLWRSRPARWLALTLVILAGVVVVLVMPVTTRQGVDFDVSTIQLPLYAKALDFVDRDVKYHALVRKITAGKTTEEARALAVFDWTRANVRETPEGFPIIDDHVWHIIIRGYGVDDQKADVFTTLATYGNISAYWIYLEEKGERLPLSLVLSQGRWRVFDVANGLVFRNGRGELATVDDIAADPPLVAVAAAGRAYRGHPYASYFRRFQVPMPPDTLRAEQQMLWPRLAFEAKRLVGLGGRQWNPEAAAQKPRR